MSNPTLSVADLELKARAASNVIEPAELHGLVCGLAAGGAETFPFAEFVQLAGTDALTDEEAVGGFVSDALQMLYAPDLTFVPLVPDDGEVLTARVRALSEWCAGFLSGFGATLSPDMQPSALPLDVQEILKDFVSISALDDGQDDQLDDTSEEQDEASFMELHEYVKVGAVLTLTLMAERQDSDSDRGGA